MASALFLLLLLLAGAVLSEPVLFPHPDVEYGGRGEEAEPVGVPGGWHGRYNKEVAKCRRCMMGEIFTDLIKELKGTVNDWDTLFC